jgi:ketosteroid isomerase-like protein
MSPDLPAVLARYFAAQNAHDIDGLVACFAPDAVVRDEGADIVGSDRIRAWKEETGAKYRVTVEPLTCSVADGCTVVVARVSGSFDGSPLDLTYRFGISDEDRIATLQVR